MMEDRIVGPLTLIQFIIVVSGGGIAFFLFNQQGLPPLVTRGGAGFLALVTLLLALGKFNDQPMYRFFKYIIAFIFAPKTRVWHKSGGEVPLIKQSKPKNDENTLHAPKRISSEQIAQLATVLDSRGRVGSAPKLTNPSTDKKGAK
jgi:hypothetical protein